MLALGACLARRGHEVTFETWSRWREHVEARGMRFVAAPEYPVFPTRERPLKPYEAVVLATAETRGPAARGNARRRRPRHPHARAGAGGRARRGADGHTGAAHLPAGGAGLSPIRARRPAAAHRPRPPAVAPARPAGRGRAAPRARRAQRDAGQARPTASPAAARWHQPRAVHRGDVPPARVSAPMAAPGARRRAAHVGAAVPRRRAARRVRPARAGGAVDRPGS